MRIELLANVNSLADAEAAAAMGASGVGLYRTEYLFLTHPDVPDEQEQFAAYKKIIAASPNHRITIRTLDLGGDKMIPYLGPRPRSQSVHGLASIRLSFEHPEFFATQIRAILRAAVTSKKNDVRLMFPMITTLEEIRKVRKMVCRASSNWTGRKAYGHVPIGLMVEVPAAAICIDSLMDEVDFISIGSNDLVQYLMAADRDNPRVSHLCQPLSPAVLRMLHHTIRACIAAGKPCTLCGEMAGPPRAFLLLFGMGLRSFSISPAFIPSIKDLTIHLTQARAKASSARAEAENHRRREPLSRQGNRRDCAESEAARYGVTHGGTVQESGTTPAEHRRLAPCRSQAGGSERQGASRRSAATQHVCLLAQKPLRKPIEKLGGVGGQFRGDGFRIGFVEDFRVHRTYPSQILGVPFGRGGAGIDRSRADERLQRPIDFGRRLHSLVGRFGQKPVDHVGQFVRDLRRQQINSLRRRRGMRHVQLHRVLFHERRPARQRVIKGATERIEIAAGIRLSRIGGLLRRHVFVGPERVPSMVKSD